jgi:hypothetical protein
VAVVQISKIQQRRGRKLTGTGMPQLASGELGWAIDSQELYIGNGSVSEGAPYVGNTKILTEHDNIFGLANEYIYKDKTIQTGESANSYVSRTLQERLDDYVNIRAFGATGDGTDQTSALQRAIDQLFFSSSEEIATESRTTLYIPAGVYVISEPIKLPSYVSIYGDGKDKTVIRTTTGFIGPAFRTISRTSPFITTQSQPKYIRMEKLSIECMTATAQGLLLGSFNTIQGEEPGSCVNSIFYDIKFKGIWDSTSPTSTINHKAITIENHNSAITTKNNIFSYVEIENFNTGVYSLTATNSNIFTNCKFYNLDRGIDFGQLATPGPTLNIFENSEFDQIFKEAFIVKSGNYNTSRGNRYLNVGNEGGPDNPSYAVINFQTASNVSVNDYFERTKLLAPNKPNDPQTGQYYVPEVTGKSSYQNVYPNQTTIGSTFMLPNGVTSLFKIPMIDLGTIFVDYIYNATVSVLLNGNTELRNILKEGTLEISCDKLQNNVTLNDDYRFIGEEYLSMSLEFIVNYGTGPGSNLIEILASNNLNVVNEDDLFYYTIRAKT